MENNIAKEKYNEIERMRSCRDSLIKDVQEYEHKIENAKLEYRIESVDRVLNYILDKIRKDEKIEENLIVHCLNKLHGNIDGVEINLKENEKIKGGLE